MMLNEPSFMTLVVPYAEYKAAEVVSEECSATSFGKPLDLVGSQSSFVQALREIKPGDPVKLPSLPVSSDNEYATEAGHRKKCQFSYAKLTNKCSYPSYESHDTHSEGFKANRTNKAHMTSAKQKKDLDSDAPDWKP